MSASTRRWAISLLLVTAQPVSAAPFFTGLGDLPGGIFSSTVIDVSIDGTVAVGTSVVAGDVGEAFVWTLGTGMFSVGPGSANAVSAGGGQVVGSSGEPGFRWNAVEGRVPLPDPPPDAFSVGVSPLDVSADGSVLVGLRSFPPFATSSARWTAADGYAFESLDEPSDLDFTAVFDRAVAVSADGSLVLERFAGEVGLPVRSYLLDSTGTHTPIGALWDGVAAFGLSPDGSLVVGDARVTGNREAFLWSETFGVVSLGDLPEGLDQSRARAVSATGVVVGQGNGANGDEAFLWDPIVGMRSLRGELVALGVDLTGWTLTDATAISFDGRTIVGNGIDPDGHFEAWLVTIPEPGTAALVTLGVAALAARARRTGSSSPS